MTLELDAKAAQSCCMQLAALMLASSPSLYLHNASRREAKRKVWTPCRSLRSFTFIHFVFMSLGLVHASDIRSLIRSHHYILVRISPLLLLYYHCEIKFEAALFSHELRNKWVA